MDEWVLEEQALFVSVVATLEALPRIFLGEGSPCLDIFFFIEFQWEYCIHASLDPYRSIHQMFRYIIYLYTYYICCMQHAEVCLIFNA